MHRARVNLLGYNETVVWRIREVAMVIELNKGICLANECDDRNLVEHLCVREVAPVSIRIGGPIHGLVQS